MLRQGDVITLWVDDKAGHIYRGEVPMVQAATSPDYDQLMAWADEVRTLKIRANADKDVEARTARSFGAEGIGLCRTEHMFFEPARINIMRQMIVADTVEERAAALDKLLPFQRDDFAALFRAIEDTWHGTDRRRLIRVPYHINDPAFAQAAVIHFREIGPQRLTRATV